MKPKFPTGFSIFDWLFTALDRRKPSDRFIISLLLTAFVATLGYSLYLLNQKHVVEIPTTGGALVEGMIGAPRFVNPVLATTKVDRDLVTLTYSALVELKPDGSLKPDLAESVTVSGDGLVYNVILKENISFHDEVSITAEDVAYTIGLIQNPDIKSPLRGNWNGVTVEVISEQELNFVLTDPYAPFIENLTVGILPKHIWQALSPDAFPFSPNNTDPVGSGPYQLDTIKRDQAGLITEYIFKPFTQNYQTPNISDLTVRFYLNEDEVLEALNQNQINGTAALNEENLLDVDTNDWQIVEKPLPRVFAVFFNQNRLPLLRDEAVREALALVVDREILIDRALNGFGSPTTSPIPPGFGFAEEVTDEVLDPETRLESARATLENGGWSQTESGSWQKEIDDTATTLSLTLRSANSPVFEAASAYLIESWRALGVEVTVELYEQSDLVQTVIRPRDYQALLFGTDVGRPLDLYPFWHSSQREDPGLNVALYTSITSDDWLEEIRLTTDENEKALALEAFAEEIAVESPAIFLFSPSFVYLLSPTVHIADMAKLSKPNERFANIEEWFINKSAVWPFFQ